MDLALKELAAQWGIRHLGYNVKGLSASGGEEIKERGRSEGRGQWKPSWAFRGRSDVGTETAWEGEAGRQMEWREQ